MKIIADKNIPYLKGIVEYYGDVTYLAGNEFTKSSIKDADVLIVRTVTYFGQELLEGSKVKLICSATIGYDHIDTKYCEQNGIEWRNAPGCNSGSVMQYITSCLIIIAEKKGFDLKDKTIGIVGVGNVGKKVENVCRLLGMRVLLNDPPRQQNEKSDIFVDLETIKKEADIITFHVPLTKEGENQTYHLADWGFFDSLSKKPIIINSARGGIIETNAIKRAIKEQKISGSVIDCWENEPNIDKEYMYMSDIATPHIAGYSADGKANASRISLENLADFWQLSKEPIERITIPTVKEPFIDVSGISDPIYNSVLQTYNPLDDAQKLTDQSTLFSELRSYYPLRREYGAYTILNVKGKDREVLKELGFIIK